MPHADPEANRAYQKAWKERNKEKVRAYARISYERVGRERLSAWRKANPEKIKAYTDAANTRRAARGQAIIDAAKDVPCADCGQRFPSYVMDLDHVPGRGQKRAGVSRLRNKNPDIIRAEVAKCDAVCANCHRMRSYARQRGHLFGESCQERRR